MRVLVVEDEEPIANAIERGLIKLGYAVDVAYDGAEAIEKASVNNYDVVCLDLNLPKLDGTEVCRRLRADRFAGGIIMLTARSAIRDRVEGLDKGADDYLVKPFAFSELAARIRAITRREGSLREPVITTRGNGFSEIIEDGVHGSIVDDPLNPAPIRDALVFWSDAERRRSARPAILERAGLFDIGVNVERTLAVLNHVPKAAAVSGKIRKT